MSAGSLVALTAVIALPLLSACAMAKGLATMCNEADQENDDYGNAVAGQVK